MLPGDATLTKTQEIQVVVIMDDAPQTTKHIKSRKAFPAQDDEMQEENNFSLLRQSMKHSRTHGDTTNRSRQTLLEGDEARRMRSTDTGPAVLHRLVGDGEFCDFPREIQRKQDVSCRSTKCYKYHIAAHPRITAIYTT